jgi:hypothetical protein
LRPPDKFAPINPPKALHTRVQLGQQRVDALGTVDSRPAPGTSNSNSLRFPAVLFSSSWHSLECAEAFRCTLYTFSHFSRDKMLFMVQYGHKIANKIRPEKGNLRPARALTLFAPAEQTHFA